MKRKGQQGGFIRAVVTIVLALIVLKYAFHLDVLALFDHPKFDPYFDKAYETVKGIWEGYIFPVLGPVWKYIKIGWEYVEKAFWYVVGLVKGPAENMLETVPTE